MKASLPDEEKYLSFLNQQGIHPERITRIGGGRNSRVWCVEEGQNLWALKEYFRHPQDPRDRLKTETNFLKFLNQNSNLGVPRVVGFDEHKNLALYSWLQGQPVKTITEKHLEQCVSFITEINENPLRYGTKELQLASEGCTDEKQHLEHVLRRVDQLLEIPTQTSIHQLALEWIRSVLRPKFQQIYSGLCGFGKDRIAANKKLELILSPSDFGFHNILEHQGQLSFLDFEYAGWDDPVKLCADYACQPQVPVSEEQAAWFCQQLEEGLGWKGLFKRFHLLLPLYRVKWCCILLNEFRSQDWERRHHAEEGDKMLRLKKQISKTQQYFNKNIQ